MKLEEIRNNIEGSSEDARFAAWMTLYSSEEAELRGEFDRILQTQDPILKILLSNFLGHIHEEKAIKFILRLMEDTNTGVVDAAEKAFDRNRYETKNNLLPPLIHSPVSRVQFFAIEKTSLGGVVDIVAPLLKMLPKATGPLLLHILAALRYFPSKKLIPIIDPYLKDPEDDIRLQAVIIFGSLYESNHVATRKQLMMILQDKSPQIRQTALWCLRRKPSQRDLKYLFRLSLDDPDPHVRQESLTELAFFPSVKVINHLLHLITTEKDRLVLLKAEGVLLSLPEKELQAGFKKALTSPEQGTRNKAVLLMAELQQGSNTYFNFLVKNLKKTKTDKEKLPIIEALGVMENKQGIPLLEKFLCESPLVSYVAMNALIRIWKNDPSRPITTYLQNEKLSFLAKQMVLQNLFRQGIEGIPADELSIVLIPYLKHTNLNLRYLAAQIILKLDRDDAFESLLEVLKLEKDPTTFRLLQENLIRLLASKPHFLIDIITKYRHHAQTIKLILSMMQEVDWFGEKVIRIISKLLSKPIDLMASDERENFVNFVFKLILQQRISFEELLKALHPIPEKEQLLRELIPQFQKQNFSISLPLPLLNAWMAEKNEKQTEVIIDLMGLSRNKAGIEPLAALICDPDLSRLKTRAIAALNTLIWQERLA